jgi:hypothetical protein
VMRPHLMADAVGVRDVGEFHRCFSGQRQEVQVWAVYKRETACL